MHRGRGMNMRGDGPEVVGKTILVVDDEPMVLSAVGRLLRTCGYEVLLAAGALDAWQCAAVSDVDIVLLDSRLRGITSSECLAGLRERGIGAPTISFSGCPAEPDAFGAMPEADRPHLHVMKPATRQELVRAVERVLSRRGAA